LGLSFFSLWTSPKDPLRLAGICFVVLLFIFDTIYALVIMAHDSLFTELATGVKERSSLAAVREGLAVIALLPAFIQPEELGLVSISGRETWTNSKARSDRWTSR
jgi:Na+/melibiose symporter-like transporter